MGEFNATDCNWKKMVLSKTDNEWTSTIPSGEQSVNSGAGSAGLALGIPFGGIKTEKEEAETRQSYQNDYYGEDSMVQEMDPLLVEGQAARRRRGSGPRTESAAERATRLAKMSAYAAQRLANETAEQRAVRLKRMSAYAAKRLAQESGEQRAARLARMSAYAARRLARETPEQRQLRLTRMSAYAAKRQARKKLGSATAPAPDSSQTLHDPLL